jgi:hypothetical protein
MFLQAKLEPIWFIELAPDSISDEELSQSSIKVSHVGELGEPASHGFSSFKFVPGTQDKVT